MKYIHYTLLCVLLLTGTSTFAQQNYFKDAKELAYFRKYMEVLLPQKEGLQFNFKNGTDNLFKNKSANELLTKLAIAVSNQPLKNTSTDTDAVDGPAGVPTQGENPQQPVDKKKKPNDAEGNSILTDEQKIEATKELIKDELAYLLLIIYGTPEQIIEAPEMPKRFDYLEKINTALKEVTQTAKIDLQSTAMSGNFAFNESAIIYGITDFIIQRAKEEMLEAQLGQIYDKLNSDVIIKQLIPNTLKTFQQFKEDNTTGLAKYGDLWKASFQQDLQNFPLMLQDEPFLQQVGDRVLAGKEEKVRTLFRTELRPAIAGSSELVYNLYLKKHLVAILQDMATKYRTGATADSLAVFKKAVIFSDVVSSIVGQFNGDKYVLITSEAINKMSVEEWWNFARITYLRNKTDLHLVGGTTMDSLANKSAAVISFLKQWIVPAVNTYNAYQQIIGSASAGIAVTEVKVLNGEDIHKLIALSFQMADNAISQLRKNSFKPELDQFLDTTYRNCVQPYFTLANQIGEGISTREYGKVLDGTLQTLKLVQVRHNSEALDGIIRVMTQYGSFMVNILEAEKPEQVEAALDELIPKGQYKLKYKPTLSVSLSAYPGAFGGWERIKKYDASSGTVNRDNSSNSNGGSLAFYLPIGLDFNQGISNKMCVSLFLQVLDLGAVLNYRLNADGDEQTNPEVSFKQILSPGGSVMMHFPHSPFVAGFGVNYTPDLRKIEETNGVSYTTNALRYGFFVGVDVTMLHIGLKRKN
ncbi:MAG TPA: hypothetical protein VJ720_03715 [Chitinophaga sp.]|nr:hypothetical protein [Chitinophaga sp.]